MGVFKNVAIGGLISWTVKEWYDECEASKQISLPLLLWKCIPFRTFTFLAGYFSNLQLPKSLRPPIIGAYAKHFGCNLQEALVSDISQYQTMNSFFTRALHSSARPIDSEADVVRPISNS